ncbi:MAG: SDR family oxidoreductase, partial [Gammaproteobacteria bacterium]|nr:SDR family oxidoreductase [Gammaproteobacteria bacterium]
AKRVRHWRGSGIGLACATTLAREGVNVTLFGRDADKLGRAAASIEKHKASGVTVRTCAGDVTREEAVAAGVAEAEKSGALTIAIANAGAGGLGPVLSMDLEQWDRVLRTNLGGTMVTFKVAGRAIAAAGGGAMCAVSSIAGARTHRFMSAYCASKAAIDNLVQNAADELGPMGIRVNSVLPGLVDTDLAAGLFATEEVLSDYLACMPLGRTGTVEDVAEAVRFLCSPQSSWITGVNLSVDGGHHLRRGPNYDVFARTLFGDDPTLQQSRSKN